MCRYSVDVCDTSVAAGALQLAVEFEVLWSKHSSGDGSMDAAMLGVWAVVDEQLELAVDTVLPLLESNSGSADGKKVGDAVVRAVLVLFSLLLQAWLHTCTHTCCSPALAEEAQVFAATGRCCRNSERCALCKHASLLLMLCSTFPIHTHTQTHTDTHTDTHRHTHTHTHTQTHTHTHRCIHACL